MTSDIKNYSFKQGLPQEFEIVDISKLYKEFPDTRTTPYRAGFYHIIWFQKGSPTHLVDFIPVQIKPNSILFLSKNTVQRFDPSENIEGKAVLFTDNFFCITDQDIKFLRSTPLFNDLFSVTQIQISNSHKAITGLFQDMETELKSNKDLYQSDILKNLLHNLLLISERESRKQNYKEIKKGADFDYVVLFKDLLEAQYKEQKKVNIYSDQLSLTEKRLNQATSKVLGKTPKQMIDERVMLEAKRLLAHTNESIKEIGFNLGFEEPTNFIKYFKKHQNSTPADFRENLYF